MHRKLVYRHVLMQTPLKPLNSLNDSIKDVNVMREL